MAQLLEHLYYTKGTERSGYFQHPREAVCTYPFPDENVTLERAMVAVSVQLSGNAHVDRMKTHDRELHLLLGGMGVTDRTSFRGITSEINALWRVILAYRNVEDLPDDPQNMRKAYTAVLQALYIDPIPEVFELEPMDFIAALELCREAKVPIGAVL